MNPPTPSLRPNLETPAGNEIDPPRTATVLSAPCAPLARPGFGLAVSRPCKISMRGLRVVFGHREVPVLRGHKTTRRKGG